MAAPPSQAIFNNLLCSAIAEPTCQDSGAIIEHSRVGAGEKTSSDVDPITFSEEISPFPFS
jgi:hypothetical protein